MKIVLLVPRIFSKFCSHKIPCIPGAGIQENLPGVFLVLTLYLSSSEGQKTCGKFSPNCGGLANEAATERNQKARKQWQRAKHCITAEIPLSRSNHGLFVTYHCWCSGPSTAGCLFGCRLFLAFIYSRYPKSKEACARPGGS